MKKDVSHDIEVTERQLSDYLPDPHNANKGSERGGQMIENSLRSLGSGRSLVADSKDVLVAGNKTQGGAINAGLIRVIQVATDGDAIIVHKRRDWDIENEDKPQARQYAYADNRSSALNLEWDAAQIYIDIQSGVDVGNYFTADEVKSIIEGHLDNEVGETSPEATRCPECGQLLLSATT